MDRYLTIFLSVVALFVVALALTYYMPVRINQTDSLPYSLFTPIKADPNQLKYGDIISFRHRYASILLAKELVGLPGDSVQVNDDCVYVNHENYGEIKMVSPSGMTLTPIQASVIPEGYVFVHGSHEDSFDSRYEEFGLVRIEDIQEVLCPIY